MLPLALTWFAGTLLALGVSSYFTQQAYDRSLLDDAYLIASNVQPHGQGLALVLTPREVGTVLFDQSETIYFSVLREDGSLVAGEASLPAPPRSEDSAYAFADIEFRGLHLRAVRLQRRSPAAFDVVMAQTTQSRSTLLQHVLAYSLVPQLLLLGLLAWWLRRTIGHDLKPLAQLQEAVDQRHASDLAAVPVSADSAEVEHLASAINALLARLTDSLRAQREFAGNVAHELRTPLAGIRALADYGLAQKDPAAWRVQLEKIATSQARASRLVDHLLALALADEAKAGVRLAHVALDDLVRDAVLRFLTRADAARVDLGARGAENRVLVAGDPTLIEGILNNLIDNALRYGMPVDGQPGSITVEIAQDAQGVTLCVIDNGPGLSSAQHSQVTRRWAQGEAGQLLGEGSGLGLAIVAQYARLLHAQFALQPAPQGQGLAASVRFDQVQRTQPSL